MDGCARCLAGRGRLPGAGGPLTPMGPAGYPTPARGPADSVLANRKLPEATAISLPHWEAALDDLLDTAG